MSMLSSAVQRSTLGLHTLEQYEPLIGTAALERIAAKANRVRTMRVAHISSTFYGGGVTELLTLNAVTDGAVYIGDGLSPPAGSYVLNEDGDLHGDTIIINASTPIMQITPAVLPSSARSMWPSERPSRRSDKPSTMKSWTAPANTTPNRIHIVPGR